MNSPTNAPLNHPVDHCCDPFRVADWRWQRARSLIFSGCRPDYQDDEQVNQIYRFLRIETRQPSGNDPQSAASLWPDLAAAHRLEEQGGILLEEIQARLLAGEDFNRIEARTGVSSPVLRAYESTFYNVTNALSATDWLLDKVLQIRSWDPEGLTPGQVWKWVAIAAGAFLLDAVIAEDLNRPEPQISDRIGLAERAGFWAREAVTPMSPSASYRITKEADALFGKAPKKGDASDRLRKAKDKLHLKILKMAARKPRKTMAPPQVDYRLDLVGVPDKNPRKRRHCNSVTKPQSASDINVPVELEKDLTEARGGRLSSMSYDMS